VAELKYKLTNDVLFKMMFVKYPDLLKRLVAALLGIQYESIMEFDIANPNIPPEELGKKFCHLDVNMIVDGQRIDLEVQVEDKGDYVERSLYYWAREYSSALDAGENYCNLPRTIVISIVAFQMFNCAEYHSEFAPIEVKRHERLTDKMAMHYFELSKLPGLPEAADEEGEMYWLQLFNAKTEEEMAQIKEKGGPTMQQAVEAYHHVSASAQFRELERLRDRTRHNEASALAYARQEERRELSIEIAEAMKNEGMDVDTISRLTKLTVEDILRL